MTINDIHIEDYYDELLQGKDLSVKPEKSWQLIKRKNSGSREDLIAISEGKKKIPYGEMFERWDNVARAFSALGINGDNASRVLTLMPNVAMTCDINYALDMTGAVADYIDPTTSMDKIENYIAQEKNTDLFVLDLLAMQNGLNKKAKELKEKFGLKNIIVYHDSFVSSLLPLPVRGFAFANNFKNGFSKDLIRFSDVLHESTYTPINYSKSDDKSLSFITHTSGTTTGIGKPIPLTDRNRNALVKSYELGQFNCAPGMTMMHFIPYFASYGVVNTTHFGLSQGFEMQELPLFTPVKFGDYLNKTKSNIVFATPSCWLSLVNDEKYKNMDLSFLVYASSGGGPISVEDEEKVNMFFKSHGASCELTKGYGLSETGGCCIFTLDDYNRVGSLGVRHPLVEVALRNPVTGELYSDRYVGTGEALIHSETVTSGVLDGKVVVPKQMINGKEYLPTKDILDRKSDGHYEYVERIDRMFPRYDGYNVYPLHIENLLQTYDEIEHCVIVPVFDSSKNGMVPKIYIQLSSQKNSDEKKLLIQKIIQEAFIDNSVQASYKANYRDIPRLFVFVDSIPKNKMDKDDFYLLKQGVDGDEYSVTIEENNMGLSSFYVESKNENKVKKFVKK